MATTTLLRVRVNAEHARKARKILGNLGLSPGNAVGVLFAQIAERRGLPFPVQEEGYAYAESEYGLSPKEIDRAHDALARKIEIERRRGRLSK